MKDETLLSDEFEAFAKREGLITESYGLRSVNSAIDVARKAWNAALQSGNSAQPVTVPDGYVLVPVEPTPEMCDVGHIGIDVLTGVTSDSEYYSTWGDSAAKLYRAMLAAAPKAPGSQLTTSTGWTGNSDANAALVMLDRIDTLDPADDDRIEEVKRIIRSLAAQKPHDAPKAPDGWIPVSERMPEWKSDYRYIPLNLLLNGRTVVQGGFDDGMFWLDGVRISNVTAWQPLPDAPKGV